MIFEVITALVIYLGTWLSTIICSKILRIVYNLHIRKWEADNGYLINYAASNNTTSSFEDKHEILKCIPFIPFINILDTIIYIFMVQNNQASFHFDLLSMGVLEKMSPLEKEEYKKDPTGANAFLLKLKVKNHLYNAGRININKDHHVDLCANEVGNDISFISDNSGIVFYEYDPITKDIHIIERVGYAKQFSEIAIKNLLMKAGITITDNRDDIIIYMDDLYPMEAINNSPVQSGNDISKSLPIVDDSVIDYLTEGNNLESENKGNSYVYKK